MNSETNLSRRKLLATGGLAIGGAALFPNLCHSADKSAPAKPKTHPGLLWPERRKKIERAWLDLLGDFPTEIPALRPIMKRSQRKMGSRATTSVSRLNRMIA